MWKILKQRVATSVLRTGLSNDVNSIKINTKPFGELTKVPLSQNHLCLFPNVFDHEKHGKKQSKKKTCNEQKDYFPQYNCSLLETVGWLGTALAIGVNFKLCNQGPIKASSEIDNCHQPYICRGISNFIWRIVSASPSKSALPEKLFDETDKPSSNTAKISDEPTLENKQQAILNSIEARKNELEDISREYFGHLATMAGLNAIDIDSRKGLAHFVEGSRLGNAKAHFNLGVCYETGKGTDINLKKAVYHYQKAADADHPIALYNLGVYYLEGRAYLQRDEMKALELFSKAAKLGVLEAQTYMGIHYFEHSKWDLAYPLLKASCQEPEAQYYLAHCYLNGLGVVANPEMAAHYFSLASNSGFDQFDDLMLECENEDKIPNNKENTSPLSQSLHTSSSTPNFLPSSPNSSKSKMGIYELAISRYLDVILPNVKTDSNSPVVNFKLGDTEFDNMEERNKLDIISLSEKIDNNLSLNNINNLMTVR